MRSSVLIILLAVVSSSALAEWSQIADSLDQGGNDIYADLASIRRSGDTVRMWDLTDFKVAQMFAPTKKYLSIKGQTEYDCKGGRLRGIRTSLYSGSMGTGKQVATKKGPFRWEPIVPNSTGELLWKIACGMR